METPSKSSLSHGQSQKQMPKPTQKPLDVVDVESESGYGESSGGGSENPENVIHGGEPGGQPGGETGGEQEGPEFGNDIPNEKSEKTKEGKSGDKPFDVPVSEVRWTGLAVAHDRSHGRGTGRAKDKPNHGTKKSHGDPMMVTLLQAMFIAGGILLVSVTFAFFVFAW